MSAFMVNKAHIDALVFIADSGPTDKEVPSHRWRDNIGYAGILPKYSEPQDCNRLGKMLIRENLASIHARYPDTIENPDDTPGPDETYWLTSYKYREPSRKPTIVEAFKLISCYEYQSCEHDGWETSVARRVCGQLRDALIGVMPGYDAAPWGWE